ncbi:hypothetical protein BD324DRAFT_682937 [Kockovaella imperatae]|uniref:Uncharacterized protein n=1 Tax=Kockovaella imperatae TaxID=4999 RepID=A0A1Y1UAE4_9TREE|nr:hypothetical protein BD324DRAFT_682937 [Kockovaella imperatae]ORX35021.1 hypothetical protein BD324DRAFT_682937 [Kockovaella imperatae]
MFAAAQPMGHFSLQHMKMAGMTLATVQMELEKHKMMPVVLIEAYLDVLNKLVEPLAIVQGMMGLRTWLGEVQVLIAKLKQRVFSGMPLNMRERTVITWYSARWRELRGGACDMGRPEAQIVLMSLGEIAMY